MARINFKELFLKKWALLFSVIFLISATNSDEGIVRKELEAIAASMVSKEAYSCVITTRMFEKTGGESIHTEMVSLKKKNLWFNSFSPKVISIRNSKYQISVLHDTKTVVFQKVVYGKNSLNKGIEQDMLSFFQNVSQCSAKQLDSEFSLLSLNYKMGQFKKLEIKYFSKSKVIARMRFFPKPESFDDAGNGPIEGKPFAYFDIEYSAFDFKTLLTEKDFSISDIVSIEGSNVFLTKKYSNYRLLVH